MIVAVDPGAVTGIATYAGGVFLSDQFECWPAVDRVAALPDVEVIVCESYTITASTLKKTRGGNWSLESIGALRWIALCRGYGFVLQTPADAKRFADDTKLRRVGWYHASTGGHANDAARHLLTYLAREDPATFKALYGS